MFLQLTSALVVSSARRCAGRLLAAVALLLPTAALAQVTYTGATASQNFGSVAVGSTSGSQALSFSVAAGTTIGSIAYLTQGAPGLDFGAATGSTCTAKTYATATTCTLNVTFTPSAPGTRAGGVVFFSAAGSTGVVLGQVLVHGVGSGPMISFGAPVLSPNVGLGFPANAQGLAIDGDDNLFTAGGNGSSIREFNCRVSCTSGSTYWAGVGGQVESLAMDGAGNLFAAIEFTPTSNGGANDYAVVKIPPGGGTAAYLTTGTPQGVPISLAVDGADNVYLAYTTNTGYLNAVFPASGGGEVSQNLSVNPDALAGSMVFDSAGNMYAQVGCNVYEFPAGETSPTPLPAAPACLGGLAIDGEGNLYGTAQNPVFYELAAGASAWNELADFTSQFTSNPADEPGFVGYPIQLVVDARGNLFEMAFNPSDPHFNPYSYGTFFGVSLNQPPTLNFATPTGVGALDKADGTQSVEIQNIGNASLDLSAVTFPADFTASTGYSNECTGSTTLTTGEACTLRVNFQPENPGPLNENIVLTDNALNVSGAQQAISISGTGIADHAATLTSPTVDSIVSGSVTFAWTGGVGVEAYQFFVGTWGVGAANLYRADYIPGTATSVSVPIPADGVTLHVRLMQELNGVWSSSDYTYTEAGTSAAAVISTPAAGSTLTATNVTFSWPGGKGPFEYQLRVGTTGPGSADVYNSPGLFTTSQTVTVPANGVTLYVRLAQQLNGTWQTADYTYTEAGSPTPAAVTSPTPGTTLAGTSVTFAWTGGQGVQQYQFFVGTWGPGAGNIYRADYLPRTATSTTVTVPADGVKLFVTLMQEIGGVWSSTGYAYTESGTSAAAVISVPTPGAMLTSTSVTFSWPGGKGPYQYQLRVGTTGPGSSDVFNSPLLFSTSQTVTVPSNGATLYVRLAQQLNGVWQTEDYTYLEMAPTPASVNKGSHAGGNSVSTAP